MVLLSRNFEICSQRKRVRMKSGCEEAPQLMLACLYLSLYLWDINCICICICEIQIVFSVLIFQATDGPKRKLPDGSKIVCTNWAQSPPCGNKLPNTQELDWTLHCAFHHMALYLTVSQISQFLHPIGQIKSQNHKKLSTVQLTVHWSIFYISPHHTGFCSASDFSATDLIINLKLHCCTISKRAL